MKINLAIWMAPLTLSLAVAWGGVCYAQEGPTHATESERVEGARANLTELVVAAALPTSMDRENVQTGDTSA